MKIKKILLTLVMMLVLISLIDMNFSRVFATDLMSGILKGMRDVTGGTNEITAAQGVINTVIGLIQLAGTGIAVIVISILGIKYMTASAGEKADIKKQAVPIVIGCLILFTAVNIMAIVADFGDTLNELGN